MLIEHKLCTEKPIKYTCDICTEKPIKYTCPRCSQKTCSLQCAIQHKKEKDCSGIRDPTAFVEIKEFNDNHFISDYCFLEDAARVADVATRLSNESTSKNIKGLPGACKFRKINWIRMPGMSRHKYNQSYFHQKKKAIFWSIEWVFVVGSNHISYTQKGAGEFLELTKLLSFVWKDGILAVAKSIATSSLMITLTQWIHQLENKNTLTPGNQPEADQNIIQVDLQKVSFLLKNTRNKYTQSFGNTKLRDFLYGQTIHEYPTIYVYCTDSIPLEFNLIPPIQPLIQELNPSNKRKYQDESLPEHELQLKKQDTIAKEEMSIKDLCALLREK